MNFQGDMIQPITPGNGLILSHKKKGESLHEMVWENLKMKKTLTFQIVLRCTLCKKG